MSQLAEPCLKADGGAAIVGTCYNKDKNHLGSMADELNQVLASRPDDTGFVDLTTALTASRHQSTIPQVRPHTAPSREMSNGECHLDEYRR